MKPILSFAALVAFALGSSIVIADEPAAAAGCAMMKPQPPPPACACCEKMKGAATAPTLEQLITNAKTAKDDQLLDALAAVLNKLIQERKAGQPGAAAPGATAAPAAPQGHQH